MPAALKSLYIVTLITTAICGAAHLATFFGYAIYQMVYFVILLFVLWPLVVWQWRRIPRRNLALEIYGAIPAWMKWLTIVLIVYVFANYFVCNALNDGGQPVKLEDGRLVLLNGKQVVRVLSPSEFATAQAIQVRVLTGHLVVFYGLAAIALRAFWIKSGPAMADAKVSGN